VRWDMQYMHMWCPYQYLYFYSTVMKLYTIY